MKILQSLKIIIPIILIAVILFFAAWYFVNWYKPTGAIVPGAPMVMMQVIQNDREIKVFQNGKEEIITIPDDKPYKYQLKYSDKIFLEQTVIVNGVRVKGAYLNENGLPTAFSATFKPGEKREYSLILQIDWQVEKHLFLDRYRGKCWKINYSIQ